MSKYLVSALLLIVFVGGIGIGYALSPQYSMVVEKNRAMMDLGEADKYVDLRYINLMIQSYEEAQKMAEQAQDKTERGEVKKIANNILESYPKIIQELYTWKKEWYDDDSKVKAAEMPNLGEFDERFDLRFLNALIAHHEEVLAIADEIRYKSSKEEILDNADSQMELLNTDLTEFNTFRSEWYDLTN